MIQKLAHKMTMDSVANREEGGGKISVACSGWQVNDRRKSA